MICDVTKRDADPFPEKRHGITSRGRLDHPFQATRYFSALKSGICTESMTIYSAKNVSKHM